MNKILILPVIAVLISILSFLPQDAHAVTSYELQVGDANGDCEAMGGTWDSSNNYCTLGSLTLNPGDSLTIDAGATLYLPGVGTIAINNGATLTNYGLIYSNNSGVTILNYGTFSNSGHIINYGLIYNHGTFTNSGVIDSYYYIVNYHDGTFTNSGTFTSSNIGAGAYGILNYGKIINSGHIINSGTINPCCTLLFENGGGEDNHGTIDNYGTIAGFYPITNHGTINEYCGASINDNAISGNTLVNIPCTSIPEFPIPFSMIIIFVAVAAVYIGIRQKMIPGFKRF